MVRDPYTVLGVPPNTSTDDAKKAYRKKAMEFHPDRHQGGTAQKRAEESFKEIQDAWEQIERGYKTPEPEPTYTSSFSDSPKRNKKTSWDFKADAPKTAGKAAPGYEARGTPPMPRTYTQGKVNHVDLVISQQHAFEGCIVPFVHKRKILYFDVRPGTMTYDAVESFVDDDMIGALWKNTTTVHVHLRVEVPKTHTFKENSGLHDRETGNMEITLDICALGLFTGGKITTYDYLNEAVQLSIPPGYNPSEPIIVKGRGYGNADDRGDLYVKINPTFKLPTALTANERKLLKKLTEMTA